MRRKVHHCYGIVMVWLLAMGWALGSNAAGTSLAPVTNTGLNNIHFKFVLSYNYFFMSVYWSQSHVSSNYYAKKLYIE